VQQFGNTALSAAIRFGLAECVPKDGFATYADIAKASGKDETLVTHIIRRLILDHIFDEQTLGQVTHTASSLALATNQGGVRDWVDFMANEINHASAKTVDAMVQFDYPKAQEVHESGFGLAFGGKTVYNYLQDNPDRMKVFGKGMDAASQSHAMKADHVVDCYDWRGLGKAKVVDVRYPSLSHSGTVSSQSAGWRLLRAHQHCHRQRGARAILHRARSARNLREG
jgi:hypothetical protein